MEDKKRALRDTIVDGDSASVKTEEENTVSCRAGSITPQGQGLLLRFENTRRHERCSGCYVQCGALSYWRWTRADTFNTDNEEHRDTEVIADINVQCVTGWRHWYSSLEWSYASENWDQGSNASFKTEVWNAVQVDANKDVAVADFTAQVEESTNANDGVDVASSRWRLGGAWGYWNRYRYFNASTGILMRQRMNVLLKHDLYQLTWKNRRAPLQSVQDHDPVHCHEAAHIVNIRFERW